MCIAKVVVKHIASKASEKFFHGPTTLIPYIAKFSRPKNFANRFQKGGGRNIRDKNIREGGSDTLRNTITWLLRLCGSSDL